MGIEMYMVNDNNDILFIEWKYDLNSARCTPTIDLFQLLFLLFQIEDCYEAKD